jgi:CheY-like chemotaxis protein
MLLRPAPSIHTAFMRFAIDAVFVDGTLQVKKIVENLRPWRIASAWRASGVLELGAGEVQRRGIAIGDQLGVVEVTDRLGAVVASPGSSRETGSADPTPGLDEQPGTELGEERERAESIAPDQAAYTTRVLLIGKDRRFRSVAAALLTRRGCAVTLGDGSARIAELARQVRADVVVLDAGTSLTAAALETAPLQTLNPPVGVVVVGEEPEQGLSAMPVLAKWGSFDKFYGAVQQARAARDLGVAARSRARLKAV